MNAISRETRRKAIISRASRKEGWFGNKPKRGFSEPSPQRGPQPHTRWEDEEVRELITMREPPNNMSFADIAKVLGRTESQCYARYNYGHHSTVRCDGDAGQNHKCSREQLLEREIRAQAYAARDYNATFFNDPLVGFRALDQRGKDKPRQPSLPVISAICRRGYELEEAR